jgi:hypothetical protein
MRDTNLHWCGAILGLAMALPSAGQTLPSAFTNLQDSLPAPAAPAAQGFSPAAPETNAVAQLRAFTDADVKFRLSDLMEILRDRRHEGWVLAAYPDPKTGQPLIGAGVSLDLPARAHPQRDPLNPHPFIEPSSAELWQAAGLDPQRLQTILGEFNDRLAAWDKKGFRKRIKTLTPQITSDEADSLLRVSAIQAAYNAKGYCRNFDRLSASQQMALSQLVYQMGVNLQEFSQFLDLINSNSARGDAGVEYWRAVQQSLIQSQWARLYRVRAASVIAMLDPRYADQPGTAEQRMSAILRPAVVRRHKARSATLRQVASAREPSRRAGSRANSTQRKKHRG